MGKATRWLKRFLGIKDSSQSHQQSSEKTTTSCFPESKHQSKSKWKSVVKSCRQSGRASSDDGFTGRREGSADVTSEASVVDRRKQAIVVPAETATEAAKPSGGERCGVSSANVSKGCADFRIRKQWAAVTIQSHFRGYLARRARRALKGLVKLQALVRGNMVRKHTANMMVRLEALLRAQARARVGRSQSQPQSLQLHSFSKSSQLDSHREDPATPENFELAISKRKNLSKLKRSGSKPIMLDIDQLTTATDEGVVLNSKSNRTFNKEKLDSPKPSLPTSSSSNRISPMKPYDRSNSSDQYSRMFTTTSVDSTACHSAQSASSYEVQSLTPVKFLLYPPTEDNQLREPVTPTRSINSLRSASSHHPSYMSGTQSSRAKTRSISAPKLRPGLERSTSTTRRVLSLHGYAAAAADQTKPISEGNFAKKAYPGSGQLDPLGMTYNVSEF